MTLPFQVVNDVNSLDPDILASFHRDDVRTQISQRSLAINVIGFLVSDDNASKTYAQYTKTSCESVGLRFTLVEASKELISGLIEKANADSEVHGIFVYYPIYGDTRDAAIKDSIEPRKDVEGLSSYWMKKLYANERFDDSNRQFKALLPCTPLAIVKLLEETEAHSELGLPFQRKTITIFNRSDVVGRPLAYMLTNDGAKVYSFDSDGGFAIFGPEASQKGISREAALQASDVIITGVPGKEFKKIQATEINAEVICLNFSSVQNFENDAKEKAGLYIPRVGPLTVAMCMRNALRLFENYHLIKGEPSASR